MMNMHYWAQRVAGRATCEMGDRTRLTWSARIRNARGSSRYIRVGDRSIIKGELLVFGHGGQVDIGSWCYIGEGARLWSAARITVRDRVLISHNVNIFDSLTHPLRANARHRQFLAISTSGHPRDIDLGERPVLIESDALIGASAIILRGVTVGEGAIVGAGSVVSKSVPPFCVVAGNPARILRELRDDER